MSFDAQEESQASGSPVELYTIAVGSSTYRHHTSIEDSVTIGGYVYTSLAGLSREKIVPGDEDLTISLPTSHEFVGDYQQSAPGQKATITIRRYHRGDTSDPRVIYKGVLREITFEEDGAVSTLKLTPVAAAFKKTIPTDTFQATCNRVLFDSKCGLNRNDYLYSGVVTAVNGNLVTVSGLEAAKGDGWATAGYVTIGVLDYRMVVLQDGDDLELVLPFFVDVSGETVSVFAGCKHDVNTCESKFSNDINFGGFPYVPTKNIFVSGLK